jgi:hypothetical protein
VFQQLLSEVENEEALSRDYVMSVGYWSKHSQSQSQNIFCDFTGAISFFMTPQIKDLHQTAVSALLRDKDLLIRRWHESGGVEDRNDKYPLIIYFRRIGAPACEPVMVSYTLQAMKAGEDSATIAESVEQIRKRTDNRINSKPTTISPHTDTRRGLWRTA